MLSLDRQQHVVEELCRFVCRAAVRGNQVLDPGQCVDDAAVVRIVEVAGNDRRRVITMLCNDLCEANGFFAS